MPFSRLCYQFDALHFQQVPVFVDRRVVALEINESIIQQCKYPTTERPCGAKPNETFIDLELVMFAHVTNPDIFKKQSEGQLDF